jgi:acid phosphatase (class A)
MKTARLPLYLSLWALFLVQAANTQIPRKLFVTPEQLNAASILPSPPANDSPKTLEELAELHRIQDTRNAEEVAHAQVDDKEESMFIFADVVGPQFKRASLPLTALLSDHVKANESVIVNPGKLFFRRPRPYHLDPTLRPICKTTENLTDYSYPSGHGTTGYLEALVLVQMMPELRDAILTRADDYAHNREVCGVHYPSDESASKLVAHAIIGLMFNNPEFTVELEAARIELRTALAIPPVVKKQ